MRVCSMGVAVAGMLLVAGEPVMSAVKYSSGSKTWDTTTSNWGTASGGPYTTATWDNAAPDSAFLEGSGGTVTLGEAMTNLHLNVSAENYTITSNTLHFSPGGSITSVAHNLKLECGVTGSPSVTFQRGNNSSLFLAPTGESMTLGTIYRPTDDYLILGGTAAGNSVAEIRKGESRAKVRKEGSGTWSLEDAYGNEFKISDGNLIANGEITTRGSFSLNGGVLHFNNPGAFGANSTILIFNGGDLDNSSALAFTASYAVPMRWRADWTFIGSRGASSDLNLGTAAVTLDIATPAETTMTLTVSNALTTLTIGGTIGDGGNGYGLGKSGAGTLVLTGNSTYSGETIANDGLLDVRVASSLANASAIQIDSSGTLRLENADNGGSAWDFAALSALNPNLRAGLAPGTAGNLSFAENVAGYTDITATVPNPSSTAYWDGTDTSGDADGGAGTWVKAAGNWDDAATGGSSVTWDADNTDNDTAVFDRTGGPVDLGSDIALRRIEVNSANYQIGNDTETHTLNFGSVEPRLSAYQRNVTIKTGITGSPAVHYQAGVNDVLLLAPPTNVTMTLGTVTRLADNQIHLGGSSTGNTVEACPFALVTDYRAKVLKVGSGTWTCNGELYGGSYYYIQGGTLIVNGRSHANGTSSCRLYDGATLVANGTLEDFVFHTGGTLRGTARVNQALSVPANATLAPGYPTGTMTVTNNNCTINGTLAITVDGRATSRLAVDPANTLTITNATLDVNVTTFPGEALVIATYGTLDGPFAAVNGAEDFVIDYAYEGTKAIALIPPPSGSVLVVH